MMCLKCGSARYQTEKRPNGFTICMDCGFKKLTSKWESGEDMISCQYCEKPLSVERGEVEHGCLDCSNSLVVDKLRFTQSQIQSKDALIKELIECVEFYGHKENWESNDYYRSTITSIDWSSLGPINAIGGKKARTILNSDAVKEWRGKHINNVYTYWGR